MNVFLAKKTIAYFCNARHKRGHGIHSPFVYDLIRSVFIDKKKYVEFYLIENQRDSLLKNKTIIEVLDLGAGSHIHKTKTRRIKDIASSSLSPKKYAQFMFRLIQYLKAENILEMGTSLGISGSYLALANPKSTFITLEGAPAIANEAQKTFDKTIVTNAQIVIGNFSETLPGAIQKLEKIDFAFIDGNHQKQATLDYFEQILPYCHENSVLIFDDICWSQGMYDAWQTIITDNRVSISIDMCKLGLIFFRKGILKQNFEIRY